VAYTLGVMTAFVALGLGLIALRAAGGSVGWGFQSQSPLFVMLLAWVLLTVGLNLSGVFEVRFAGAGAWQGLAAGGGLLGSYATGLLAVLVATPCTAPFLALSVVPGVARLLPRPGAWMDVLWGALAFPMYAAVAWLVALPSDAPAATANAQAFTPSRLAVLRAKGRPVFVNMTAALCVTCLVNERIALSPAAVQARFAPDVTYLQGD